MTVTNTTCKNTYPGTGSQSVFPYTYRIVQASDLLVQKVDPQGVISVLALTTDYTVDGVQNDTGGNVTLVAGNLPSGYTLLILNDPSPLQGLSLTEGGQFGAVNIMRSLDLLTRQNQALRDRVLRSPRVPASESPVDSDFTLPAVAQRANKLLGFDPSGRPIAVTGGGGGPTGQAYLLASSFGAVGDDSTDNTVAIQTAINYALTFKRGARIVFSPGIYICGALTIDGNGPIGQSTVTLDGLGQASIILKAHSNASLFTITENCQHVYIENMWIDGNKTNQSGTSHGIYCPSGVITYAASVRMRNVVIINFLTDNIHIELYRSLGFFTDVQSEYAGRYCGYFDSVDHSVVNGKFGFAGSHCVYLGNASISFIDSDCYFAGAVGMYISGLCQACRMTNHTFNANQQHGLQLAPSSLPVPPTHLLTGAIFSTNGRAAANTYDNIHLDTNEGLSITNARFTYAYDGVTYQAYPRYHLYAVGNGYLIPIIGCFFDPTSRTTDDINTGAKVFEQSNRGTFAIACSSFVHHNNGNQLIIDYGANNSTAGESLALDTGSFAGNLTASQQAEMRRIFLTTTGANADGSDIAGLRVVHTVDPAGTLGANFNSGIVAFVQTNWLTNTRAALATLQGAVSKAVANLQYNTGGTLLAALYGHIAQPQVVNQASGGNSKVSAVYGGITAPGEFSSAAGATTTIDDYYGHYCRGVVTSGAGTFTITRNWGYYQDDAAAVNYYAGITKHAHVVADLTRARITPTNGSTTTIPDNVRNLVIDPGADIAGCTVKMPANPVDGQVVWVVGGEKTVTALTLSANTGQTMATGAAPTTMVPGARYGFVYFANLTKWFPGG